MYLLHFEFHSGILSQQETTNIDNEGFECQIKYE